MKSKKRLIVILLALAVAACVVVSLPVLAYADEVKSSAHIEQYRPQLGYTQNEHWNNDPNGLLYVPNEEGGGTYHMYYQYGADNNRWSTMHWGHATSTDLVHWQQHDVAIYPNMPWVNGYNEDAPSGPIFSGSAVYVSQSEYDDKTNPKSKAYHGAGFYAVFTQPNQNPQEGVGDQRQSIAWSADGELYEFSTFEEIIPNNFDGVSRGDFRDPKVFWHEGLDKWMMVVGGGEILQFTSDDLKEWTYLGTTGFWGECPDLFALENPNELKDSLGEQTWVLLMSPEDKPQSHEYNGTSRETHEYPNEYYVFGSCDDSGLFTAYDGETLRKFSFGFDSYAVQTFNNVPGGRRIGVSWAANWKTVDDYAEENSGGLRDNWNGGMTMIYELTLVDLNGELALARNPVSEYNELRRNEPLYRQKNATIGEENILSGVRSSLAEIDVILDVIDTAATYVKLQLASSAYEHTDIIYDIEKGVLTVDRSNSSLSANNTARYRVPYIAELAPQNGKVRLHAYLDWGNLFVSGGEGEVSANVAIFPSLYSNGMSLTSDGEVSASVEIYALNSIWDNEEACAAFDSFYLSASDETMYAGETLTVLACSPNPEFSLPKITVAADGDAVSAAKRADGSIEVSALKVGKSVVTVKYENKEKQIKIAVLSGTADSDLEFTNSYAGKWTRDNGIAGSASGDGFVYSQNKYTNFTLSATVTAQGDNSAAFGIMFAAGDSYHTYYCANYDYAAREAKVWMSGGESIATYSLALRRGDPVNYKLTVYNGDITVEINGLTVIVTNHGLYESGYVGLNVFNGTFVFDDIRISSIYGAGEQVSENVGDEKFIVRNETVKTYLSADDYTVDNGVLTLNNSYTASLVGGKKYDFTIMFESGKTSSFTLDTYAAVQIFDSYRTLGSGDSLMLALSLGMAKIEQVTLDGKAVDYAYENSSLLLNNAAIAALTEGDHTVRILTDKGALEFVFGYKIVPPVPENKTGVIISIIATVLIACAAAAFAVYWIVSSKRKARSEKAC